MTSEHVVLESFDVNNGTMIKPNGREIDKLEMC